MWSFFSCLGLGFSKGIGVWARIHRKTHNATSCELGFSKGIGVWAQIHRKTHNATSCELKRLSWKDCSGCLCNNVIIIPPPPPIRSPILQQHGVDKKASLHPISSSCRKPSESPSRVTKSRSRFGDYIRGSDITKAL